jgi:hypothetical protein
MSLVAGTRLGPYEIQAAIGAGGMGARDTRVDRTDGQVAQRSGELDRGA